MQIVEALALPVPCVVAVVGCGGKTSFIERVATSFRGKRDKKILISPTTKMYPLNVEGVDCLGVLNSATGKLEALPEDHLADLTSRYDMTLLEADGSQGLPLKGWREDEPVVPRYCTHTIGIVTINALGRPATRDVVFRMPEFLSLTGLHEGEIVTAEAQEAMVCAPYGMFKNGVGRLFLFLNQVEDEQTFRLAQGFLANIKKKDPGRFARLLYGSVHQDVCWEV